MIPREILKKVRQIEIRTRHIVNDVFAGQYHSAFKGQGMEFEEVREYIPGDDIRSIDWNVTARTGVPFIKKFREERELTVMLVVDVSGSQEFGSQSRLKRDFAAEMTALLAFAAIRNNDKVGLILHSDHVEHFIPPGKGPRHVMRVASDVLNTRPSQRKTALAPAIEYLNHITSRKCIVFFIGDFLLSDDYQRPLSVAARRHDAVAIAINDHRERSFPSAGVIRWRDAETGASRVLDTSHAPTRQWLVEQSAKRRQELLRTLGRTGVDVVEVDADEEYDRALIKFFRQRAARISR